jgi:hypothetical protein
MRPPHAQCTTPHLLEVLHLSGDGELNRLDEPVRLNRELHRHARTCNSLNGGAKSNATRKGGHSPARAAMLEAITVRPSSTGIADCELMEDSPSGNAEAMVTHAS